MNLPELFKEFLSSSPQGASSLTIKNYLADIKQFIRWYESFFNRSFNPEEISFQTISSYKKAQTGLSAPSIDRHISSLRKFFKFLKLEGHISQDPFEENAKSQKPAPDPWRLKDFKNFLYVYNASHLTIKNYVIDMRQFLSWVEEVSKSSEDWIIEKKTVFELITPQLVEEYKHRLINQTAFSPASINRKLSSIRRFMAWAQEENLLKEQEQVTGIRLEGIGSKKDVPQKPTTYNLQPTTYSSFPPLRLMQKLSRGSGLAFDEVFIAPIVAVLEKVQHLSWLNQGKPIFTASQLPPLTAFQRGKIGLGIKNLPKSFYAPAFVSVKHFPLRRRMWHHARYTRPDWYKTYRTSSVSGYLNFTALVIFIAAVVLTLYNAFFQQPIQNQPVLAAAPTAPLRILSFQGRLTDTSDNPITTATQLRFLLYNNVTSSASARLWEEKRTVTPDSDGIFAVLLGSDGSGSTAALCNGQSPPASPATGACGIMSTLFSDNNALWLGVTVESTAELTPRQQIATVAFATSAETLQGLEPITNSSATTNVVLALNSSGNLSIGGSATPTFEATGGAFTLKGAGVIISTTSNGNIQLAPDGIGKIDMQKPIQNSTNNNNISTAQGAVEINDLFAVLATSSGQSAFTLNQDSTGPILSASVSGTAKFTVGNGGDITIAGTTGVTFSSTGGINLAGGTLTDSTDGVDIADALEVSGLITADGGLTVPSGDTTTFASFTSNGGIFYGNTTGVLSQATAGTSSQCLLGGTTPAFGSCATGVTTSAFWNQGSGALFANNSTVDLLVGGQATTSAKFAFTGMSSLTNQTQASISGQLIVMPNNGYSGRVGIGITNPLANLSVVGIKGSGPSTTDKGVVSISTDSNVELGIGNYSASPFGMWLQSYDSRSGNSTTYPMILQPAGGNVGLGTTTPTSELHVTRPLSFGATGKALAIFDQIESQDILTASASGTPLFTITNAGGIKLGTSEGSSGECVKSGGAGAAATFGTCTAAGGGSSNWTLGAGFLTPNNSTVDLLVGGQATTSAKFAVLNLNTGTPTASISANASSNATYLTGTGNLQTVRNNTLTIGGDTTGNVAITPNNGGAGSLLTVNSLLMTLAGTTTLTASSLTLFTGGATAIDFTEFDVAAATGSITINDGGDAGNVSVEGTVLDIDSLDFVGVGTLSTVGVATIDASTDITLDADGADIFFKDAGTTIATFTNSSTDLTIDIAGGQFYLADADTINIGGLTAVAYNAFANSGEAPEDAAIAADNDLYIGGDLEVDGTITGNITGNITGTASDLACTGCVDATDLAANSVDDSELVDTLNYSGNLTLSGTTFDVNSTAVSFADTDIAFDGASTTFTTTGDLTLSVGGGNIISSSPLNIGGGAAAAYNYFGDAAGTPTVAASDDDLFIEDDLEVGDTASVSGTLTLGGTSGIIRPATGDLSLQYKSGANTWATALTIDDVTGNVGIGTTGPSNSLDIYSTADSSLLRIRGASNATGGLYGYSGNSTSGYFSVGGEKVAGTWTARGTTAALFGADSGAGNALDVYGNTGLTSGNSFSPTQRFYVTTGGNVVIPTGTLTVSGAITFSTFTSNGGPLYTNASGVLAQTTAGTSTQCLIGGTTPSFSDCAGAAASAIFWNQANGALFPKNSTVDLLIGGQATTSAKFAVLNVNSGTPTASISANSGNNALYLTGDGTLATTNRGTITIGSSSTYNTSGNILLAPNGTGNVGIGTTAPTTGILTISEGGNVGQIRLMNSTAGGTGLQIAYDTAGHAVVFNTVAGGIMSLRAQAGSGAIQLSADGGTTSHLYIPSANGNVGIGTTTPAQKLDVAGSIAINGDTFVADGGTAIWDISGTTRFATSVYTPQLTSAVGTQLNIQGGGISNNHTILINPPVYPGTAESSVFNTAPTQGTNVAASFTNERLYQFNALTLNADATPRTITNAATVYIAGAITAGTNLTITNNYALWVDDGTVRFDGNVIGPTTGTMGFWQRASGALAPTNITDDLLLGATSTASAKFAFLNVAGGTPTASISANSGNIATYLTGDGNLQTTNGQTLTLGGTTTGLVNVNDKAGSAFTTFDTVNSRVGIGTTGPSTKLDVVNTAFTGTTPLTNNILRLASNANGAAATINLTDATTYNGYIGMQAGNLHFGANTTSPQMTLLTSGSVGIGDTTPDAFLEVLGTTEQLRLTYTDGTVDSRFTVDSSGNLNIDNTGTKTTIADDLTITGGNITSALTLDLTLAVTGITTLTGNLNANGGLDVDDAFVVADGGKVSTIDISDTDIALTGATTTFTTTGAFTLTPGGAMAFGDGGDSFAVDTSEFDITAGTGAITINDGGDVGNISVEGTVLDIDSLDFVGAGTVTSGANGLLTLTPNGTGNTVITSDFDSGTTIGTAITGEFPLLVRSGIANNAAFVVDNLNNGDLITASASGTTKFTVSNTGALTSAAYTNAGGILYTATTGLIGQTAIGTSAQCLLGGTTPNFGSCGASSTIDTFWNQSSGLLFPNNSTVDLTIGGQSSTSAKFAFLNVLTGTPTLKIFNSTSAQSLNLSHDGTDANIIASTGTINIGSGGGTLYIQTNIQNDTTNFTGAVKIADKLLVQNSEAAGTALAVFDNTGAGDIFTASASGTPKFTISNGGNIISSSPLNIGGGAAAAYNYFGDAAGTPTVAASDDDLFIEDDLEVGDTASISGTLTMGGAIRPSTGNLSLHYKSAPNTWAAAMTIDTVGNVGIGNAAPAHKLQVTDSQSASSMTEFINTNNSSNADGLEVTIEYTGTLGTGNNFITFQTSGGTDIGQIEGNGAGGVQYTTSSDRRLKENITDTHFSINDLMKIKVRDFDFISAGVPTIGFIAQELYDVYPRAVSVGGDNALTDPWGIDYGALTPLLVKAIQDQQGQINALASASGAFINTIGDLSFTDQTLGTDSAFTVPHYFTLNDALGNPIDRVGAFAEIAVARLTVGSANIQQLTAAAFDAVTANIGSLTANTLAITTDSVTIAGETLHDYIARVVEEIVNNQSSTGNNFTSPIASVGTLNVDEIKPNETKTVAVKLAPDEKLEVKDASDSAVVSIDSLGNATFSGRLAAESVDSRQLTVDGEASISGSLRTKKLIADDIESEAISKIKDQISNLSTSASNAAAANYITNNNYYTASQSGSFAFTEADGYVSVASFTAQLAQVQNLNAENAVFSQSLISYGTSSFYDIGVASQISVGAQLTITDTAINVLGDDLKLQPLKQGGIAFVGGDVYIDPSGNLTVQGNARFAKDVEIEGKLSVNIISPLPGKDLSIDLASGSGQLNIIGDVSASGSATFGKLNLGLVSPALAVSDTEVIATGSAGVTQINAYKREMTINNALVTENSLIYITPTSSTGNQVLYLLRQEPGVSFTVGVQNPTTGAIPFNWIIVN